MKMESENYGMRKGRFTGVGVGPGDPELMTLKAVRVIEGCDVVVIPVSDGRLTEPFYVAGEETECLSCHCVAYQIAKGAVPGMDQKGKLFLPMPMTKEKERLRALHDRGSDAVCDALEQGRNLAFLTLGDPTVYSTCMYIYKRVRRRGYETELVPGVPSFCAAAARLDISLVENKEELHILPASYGVENGLSLPGTKVLMKAGRSMPKVRQALRGRQEEMWMAENCYMEGERLFFGEEELPDEAGYYSILVVKEKGDGK